PSAATMLAVATRIPRLRSTRDVPLIRHLPSSLKLLSSYFLLLTSYREQSSVIECLMFERRGRCGPTISEDEERRAIEVRARGGVGNRRHPRTQRREAGARPARDLRLRDRGDRAAGFGCGQDERKPSVRRRR